MMLARLATLFPVPRFMTLPSVAVDISDTSIKYLELERRAGQFVIASWGEVPLAAGSIERGEIKNAAAVHEGLRAVRAATGADYARVALPEEHAYLFETSLNQGLTDEEIRVALEFRLEENVPLPARDAVFAFEPLGNAATTVAPVADTLPQQMVSVTAYHRATAESYAAACYGAGIIPVSLEVEPAAMTRAVVPAHDTGTRLILDFGKTRCGIGITHHGVLMYTATIEVGGRDVDAALQSLYPEADAATLLTLKNETGLLVDDKDRRVADAFMPFMTKVRDELAATLAFWHSHLGAAPNRKVTEIILCGGLANVAGCREYLAEEMGIETNLASVWRHVFFSGSVVPPITRRQSYGYATVIGLALGGFVPDQ